MSADDGLLRLKMQNGAGAVLKASKHNKRKLASHKGADSDLSHLNQVLRGPSTPEDVAAMAKTLMSAAGIHTLKRKDNITAIEAIASLPVGSVIDPLAYFTDFNAWAEKRFGKHNILSADIHLDEAAPHCHILILPLVGDRLDASGIVGNRAALKSMNSDFHSDVASKYGLRLAPPKLSGDARRNAAKQVRERLIEDADVTMLGGVWASVCDAIDRYPEPFVAELGILLQAKPSKTFEQIATSTGKGPKTAAAEASRDRRLTTGVSRTAPTTIGVEDGSEDRPLSCVGVAPIAPPSALPAQPTEAHHPALQREQPAQPRPVLSLVPPVDPDPPITRHRDSDMDPANWNSETGENMPRPAVPQSAKAAARAWAANALLQLQETEGSDAAELHLRLRELQEGPWDVHAA